ncbi:hypothetical protein ACQPUY_08425 [Clostridium nigeriense]
MKKIQNNTYKVQISYIDKSETWNKLSDFIISFIMENKDILEVNDCNE